MSAIDDSSLKMSRTVTSITSPISDDNEAHPKDLREASNEKRVSALSYRESNEIDKIVDLSSSLNVNQTSDTKDVVNSTAPQSCTDKGTNDTYFTDSEYFPISPRSASSLESQRTYHNEDDLSYSLNLSSLNSSFEKDSMILSPTDCKMSTPETAKSTVEKGTIASIFPGKRTNKVTPCPVILENEFSAVSQFGTNSREGSSTDATNNISSNMRKNSITFNELRVSTTIAKFDFLAKQLWVESKTSENVQDDLQGFRYDKDAPGKVSCCSASTLSDETMCRSMTPVMSSNQIEALVRVLEKEGESHAYDVLRKEREKVAIASHVYVVDTIRTSIFLGTFIATNYSSFDELYLIKLVGTSLLCFLSTSADVEDANSARFNISNLPFAYGREIFLSRKSMLLLIYIYGWLELCDLSMKFYEKSRPLNLKLPVNGNVFKSICMITLLYLSKSAQHNSTRKAIH